MERFHLASSTADDWAAAVRATVDGLGKLPAGTNLGFLYVTDLLAGDSARILAYLRERTGIPHWIGTVGVGIVAGRDEYFDRPALAVMVGAVPEGLFRVFPSLNESAGQLGAEVTRWAREAAPTFGIVHGDPANSKIVDVIDEMAQSLSCFLVGALTASRSETHQFADGIAGGGISGILLSPEAAVATGLTQGCSPVGPVHLVSEGIDNILMGLDGRRALDVFVEEMGERLGPNFAEAASRLHVALPIEGSDTGDYLVRNLVGIDPNRGWIGVGCAVKPGDRIMFVRRDRNSARRDLKIMVEKVLARAGGAAKGALYVSCVARGPNMFGSAGEASVLHEVLGDIPLIGIYANGEISNNRLYGYTGVLTLFL